VNDRIITAGATGFCFGVDRAVNAVLNLLDEGRRVCTLGAIIHNPQIVEDLSLRGVRIVNSPEEVLPGEVLVIRSHGAAPQVVSQADALGLEVMDATCPFVKKIHTIVERESQNGHEVIIAGNQNHPEVIGIKGFCRGLSYIIKDENELELLLKTQNIVNFSPIMVAQTTFKHEKWEKLQKILKKVCTNAAIFDTICNATLERQQEADKLSRMVDAMIVAGGRGSSNTTELCRVCEAHCARTYHVEKAEELYGLDFGRVSRVGITTGASTPSFIIKEVIHIMSEILEQNLPQEETAAAADMAVDTAAEEVTLVEENAVPLKSIGDMTFEEALEQSLSNLNSDQRVVGIVMAVTPTEVQVDIGRKHAGYIPQNELSSDPGVKPADICKVGDSINLIVMKTNDQEGTVMLSKKRFDALGSWDKVVEAKESGEVLTGRVTEVIKGGVIANVKSIKVFVPASHSGVRREEPLEQLLNTEVSLKIIEIGHRRRAIGSIRLANKQARGVNEEAFWAAAEVGKAYSGTVKSLTSYGAFVDLGGIDGMVHISELSWGRIKHPSEIVNPGDIVDVYIKELDAERRRISLGFKKAEDNPWEILKRDYDVDQTVQVTVVSLTMYGAFARIIDGIDGLIHISQISDRNIAKASDVLNVGDVVNARIIAIDFERKRVSLSLVDVAGNDEQDSKIAALADAAPAEEAAPIEDTAPAEEATTEPEA